MQNEHAIKTCDIVSHINVYNILPHLITLYYTFVPLSWLQITETHQFVLKYPFKSLNKRAWKRKLCKWCKIIYNIYNTNP